MVVVLFFSFLGFIALLIIAGADGLRRAQLSLPRGQRNVETYDFNIRYEDFKPTVENFFRKSTPAARKFRSAPEFLLNEEHWWRLVYTYEDAVFAKISGWGLYIELTSSFDEVRREVKFKWDTTDEKVAEPILRFTIDEIRMALSHRIVEPAMLGAPTAEMVKALREDRQIIAARREMVREWPSPQDYNEAIQAPQINFESEILKASTAHVNEFGLPRAQSGAFASVYKVTKGNEQFAVKCFLTLVFDQEERYERISNFVLSDDLEYTVDFDFIIRGIRVRSRWYPVLRMNWVEGLPLNDYITRHRHEPEKLQWLCEQFLVMTEHLRRVGIAHGDLQHGNILITDAGIRLVDYDCMFVPGMGGWSSNEIGHRNYQHPQRTGAHFGPWLDNFSALSIYTSLRAVTVQPELWERVNGGDECLLFRQSDYASPDNSQVIQHLVRSDNCEIRKLGSALLAATRQDLVDIPYLADVIEHSGQRAAGGHP